MRETRAEHVHKEWRQLPGRATLFVILNFWSIVADRLHSTAECYLTRHWHDRSITVVAFASK